MGGINLDRHGNKILVLILLLAIFLRFYDLGINPGWYSDEGSYMDISWNLANGELRVFALDNPFVPHPPLFFIIGGILLKFLGNDIVVLKKLYI